MNKTRKEKIQESSHKVPTKKHKILKFLGALLLALIFLAGAYFCYLNLSYYRLDDNLSLSTENNQEKILQTGQDLTLVSSNIGYGAFDKDFSFFMDGGKWATVSNEEARSNIANILKPIEELDPDFCFFQEVDKGSGRTGFLDEDAYLNSILDAYSDTYAQNYDSPFFAFPLYDMFGKVIAGLSTYSKYFVSSATRYSLPISDSFTKFFDLDRCFTATRIPVDDGKELVLLNCHTSAYGADESIIQAQVQKILDVMEDELSKGNYVIAGGDFNQDMVGNSDETFNNGTETWAKAFPFDLLPDNLRVMGQGDETQRPTCRDSGKPYDGTNHVWVVDSFIVSNNISVLDYSVLNEDFAYSDHNPIVLKVSLD